MSVDKDGTDVHGQLLVTFLMTKLDGKAVEVVPAEPKTVEEIIERLKTIKLESSKVVSSRMTSLRLDRSKVSDFSEQAKQLTEMLQRSLVIEGVSREKAEEIVIDETIKMCRSNARSDLVKAVLAATTYSDPEEVVAKLVLESSKETQEKQVLAYRAQFRGKRGRGRGRGGHHGNDDNQGQRQDQYGQGYKGYSQEGCGRTWYRGRGRGRGNYQNYQNQSHSVRVMEVSGNEEPPQRYQQLWNRLLLCRTVKKC